MAETRTGRVDVGAAAPDFTLDDQHGQPIHLQDLLTRGPVVLYFYPKDDTPGCTTEACSFRDSYDAFRDAGAEVVGVSSDATSRHASFADKHHLPFVLLADPGARVRREYGARDIFGLVPGRVTFVIDQAGVVRHRFSSQMDAARHIREALAVLEGMPREA